MHDLPVTSNGDSAATDETSSWAEGVPVEEVLAGLRIPRLPVESSARALCALVQIDHADGSIGWVVRVTANVDDDELLGVLTGYVEHLKQAAAASWDEGDPTRPG